MAESIYEKAAQIIEGRRKKRDALLRQRREEVFAKIPRIAEIEGELDRFGMRMLIHLQ